jgi:hypothetical protein
LHSVPPSLDHRTARQPACWRTQEEKVAPFLMEIDNFLIPGRRAGGPLKDVCPLSQSPVALLYCTRCAPGLVPVFQLGQRLGNTVLAAFMRRHVAVQNERLKRFGALAFLLLPRLPGLLHVSLSWVGEFHGMGPLGFRLSNSGQASNGMCGGVDHGKKARADRCRQRRPSIDQPGQVGVDLRFTGQGMGQGKTELSCKLLA